MIRVYGPCPSENDNFPGWHWSDDHGNCYAFVDPELCWWVHIDDFYAEGKARDSWEALGMVLQQLTLSGRAVAA